MTMGSTARSKALKMAGGEGEKRDIEYYRKNVYGNEMNYLHHPDVAKAHKILTGQTTLSENHKTGYEMLGHKVVHIPKN